MGSYTSIRRRLQGRKPLSRAQSNRLLGSSKIPQWAVHLEVARCLADVKKTRVYQHQLFWLKAFVSEAHKMDKGTPGLLRPHLLPSWDHSLKCGFSSYWITKLSDEVHRRGECFRAIITRGPGSLVASRLLSKKVRKNQPLIEDTPLLEDSLSLLVALDLKHFDMIQKYLQDPLHEGWNVRETDEYLNDRHVRDYVARACKDKSCTVPDVKTFRR